MKASRRPTGSMRGLVRRRARVHGQQLPKDYATAPAKLPFDHSKCVGKKLLTMIWLALHSPTWQAYINCAVLEGASASSSASEDTSSTTGAEASTAPSSSSGKTGSSTTS